jgi:peptidoglycan LD-endopeptidase LytH
MQTASLLIAVTSGAIILLAGGCRFEERDRDGDDPDIAPHEAVPNPEEANPPEVGARGAVPEWQLPDMRLMIPVSDVEPDELVDTFTESRGRGRPHDAIDILAPRGRPVLAAVPGEILRLFESERGGITVYQRGPDDVTVYYYAHLEGYRPSLEEGQYVAQGETIGYVGDSGNAPPGVTHLHFAIWIPDDPEYFWQGEALNPYPLLKHGRPAP